MKFSVRQTYDFVTVLELDRKIFPTDDSLEIKQEGAYWLATYNNKPVGFCAIHPLANDPRSCFLARAGVLRSYQRHGLQKRMLSVREAWARKEGYSTLLTYTQPWNWKSMASLIKRDYKLYTPAEYWAENHSLYFIKKL